MTLTQIFHISLEAWGGIFCFIAAIGIGISKNRPEDKTVMMMEFTTALLLWMDAIAWGTRGASGTFGYLVVRISNFSVFVFTYYLSIEYTNYVVALLKGKSGFPIYTWLWAGYMLNLCGIILVIYNLFSGMFYYFDAQNYYHRADSYNLLILVGFMGVVINFMLLIFNYEHFRSGVFWALLSYLIFPVVGGVIQMYHYGVAILNIAIALSMLLIFQIWLNEKNRQRQSMRNQLILLDKKIAQMQQDIMLSQIRPHFLYNSLSAIAMLCEKNPPQAKKATIAFADYLRGNMDALSNQKMIPFEKELTHIENYLNLEQIRFGDDLEIIYDIETVEFRVPVLSVQPLVENAVKHGIRRKGTVVIRSQEDPKEYLIQVIDDGRGFDPEKTATDRKSDPKRSHVGIANVKNRLMELCQGTLEYSCEQGKGTVVTLHIPKN